MKTMDILENHKKANELREANNQNDALSLYIQALIEVLSSKDKKEEAVHILLSMSNSYRHIYKNIQEIEFIMLAKNSIENALELCDEYRFDTLYPLCHENMGSTLILEENYLLAYSEFEKAKSKLQNTKNDNIAQLANINAHMGKAAYKLGREEEAKALLNNAVQILEAQIDTIDSYTKDVWLTGAYITLLELYKNTDNTHYADIQKKFEAVLNSNDKLIIRKKEFEEIIK